MSTRRHLNVNVVSLNLQNPSLKNNVCACLCGMYACVHFVCVCLCVCVCVCVLDMHECMSVSTMIHKKLLF